MKIYDLDNGPASDGPANDGPANDSPANNGPANDSPANDGPTNDETPSWLFWISGNIIGCRQSTLARVVQEVIGHHIADRINWCYLYSE
jgi:hypothetical protein